MNDTPVVEIWKNNAAGRVVVRKMGQYGVQTEEMVEGGRVFNITQADRKLNQQMAAREDLDVFSNGMLTPVQIGDAAAEFASNPNLMTEEDMRDLVKAHPKTFDKRLSEISNSVVVAKILEIAREEDCTIKRVEAIEARLEAIDPVPTVKIKTHAPSDDRSSGRFPVVNS